MAKHRHLNKYAKEACKLQAEANQLAEEQANLKLAKNAHEHRHEYRVKKAQLARTNRQLNVLKKEFAKLALPEKMQHLWETMQFAIQSRDLHISYGESGKIVLHTKSGIIWSHKPNCYNSSLLMAE